jgi:hypothetical protein
MANIKVDGQLVEVPDYFTLMQAAEAAGAEPEVIKKGKKEEAAKGAAPAKAAAPAAKAPAAKKK